MDPTLMTKVVDPDYVLIDTDNIRANLEVVTSHRNTSWEFYSTKGRKLPQFDEICDNCSNAIHIKAQTPIPDAVDLLIIARMHQLAETRSKIIVVSGDHLLNRAVALMHAGAPVIPYPCAFFESTNALEYISFSEQSRDAGIRGLLMENALLRTRVNLLTQTITRLGEISTSVPAISSDDVAHYSNNDDDGPIVEEVATDMVRHRPMGDLGRIFRSEYLGKQTIDYKTMLSQRSQRERSTATYITRETREGFISSIVYQMPDGSRQVTGTCHMSKKLAEQSAAESMLHCLRNDDANFDGHSKRVVKSE